jgi:hypothetical protein
LGALKISARSGVPVVGFDDSEKLVGISGSDVGFGCTGRRWFLVDIKVAMVDDEKQQV